MSCILGTFDCTLKGRMAREVVLEELTSGAPVLGDAANMYDAVWGGGGEVCRIRCVWGSKHSRGLGRRCSRGMLRCHDLPRCGWAAQWRGWCHGALAQTRRRFAVCGGLLLACSGSGAGACVAFLSSSERTRVIVVFCSWAAFGGGGRGYLRCKCKLTL